MTKDATTYIETLAGLYPEQGLSFSIHRKMVFLSAEGKEEIAFPGSVFTDINEAARIAKFWSSKGHDVYLAMGGEREVGTSDKPRKYPPAIRKLYNIGACASLYMDIDVKEKAYATQRDALIALKRFLVKYNIPMPSLMVSSGTGGIHVYWVSDQLFSPSEHKQLSDAIVERANEFGLLYDPECTRDLCRLLRVPDTYNFKTNPASPVKLLHSGSKIALSVLRERLKVNNVVLLPGVTSIPTGDENDDLLQQKKQYALADIDKVANYCEFIHNTLMSGGASHNEAIWKHTVTLASYCEDGRNVAHRLSNKHQGYDQGETDLKYDQVELDRRNNPRLGPTHCSVLKQIGVSECSMCQYFQLNTTPVNVPLYTTAQPAFNPSHNPNSDLPTGYYRDKLGTIWTDFADAKTGANNAINVFPYTLIYNSTFAESGTPEYSVVFTTLEGSGHTKVIKIPMGAVSSKEGLMASLAKNGLPMLVEYHERKFFVALQSLLRNHDDTLVTTNPLGWHTFHDGSIGFSYNGNCYSQGKVIRAQRLDGELARAYSVIGEEKYWQELSELVIKQDRPDINLIIACAFAAPIMTLTGHSGICIGAWSSKSGLGKSTALSLCQAVWGSPSRMQGLDDTVNQVMDTMATLKNMPICWDDIKGNMQTERMANLLFSITRGREKGRLTRNAKQAQQRDFESLLVWTANHPLLDEIIASTRGTAAGQYRIFEYQCNELFESDLNVGHITELTGQLRKNHGHVGQKYAEYIGRNYDMIYTFINKMREKIEDEVKMTQSDRYWTSTAACLIVGARLANGLRITKFNLSTFEPYVYSLLKSFRTAVSTSGSDFSRISDVEEMLGEFLHAMSLNTLKTDVMCQRSVGRPTKGAVKVLNDNIVFTRQKVNVQISQKELLVRVADPAISEWCRLQKITKGAFTGALKKHFKGTQTRGRIGSGTEYVSPPMLIWELDLSKTALGKEIEF